MDANGQRFWMLADEGDWALADATLVRYDIDQRKLSLADVRESAEFTQAGDPVQLSEVTRQAVDKVLGRAFWDQESEQVLAIADGVGFGDPESIASFGPGETPTDLAMGFDGVLYAAVAGRVDLIDRRERWQPASVSLSGFDPFRLAPRPEGGVWVLDRANRRLGLVEGEPLPERPAAPATEEVFRGCLENPRRPTLRDVAEAGPADETPVAIAASPGGRLALLSWQADGQGVLRTLGRNRDFGEPIRLGGAVRPYSLVWLDEDAVAALLAGVSEAPAYRLGDSAEVLPSGDLYPLRGHDSGPFLNGPALPPRYPVAGGSRALRKLSLRSFAKQGEASNGKALDSREAQTVWHRLYLEARIPENCGVRVRLAATATADVEVAEEDWFEHRFGAALGRSREVPTGAWVSKPSEIPFHPGLSPCGREPNRSGLFTALIQRSGRRVRSLTGRFLRVRVELIGDGQETPEIWALRAYGSRFSYLNRYLPELYRETVFGPAADETGPSTPPDFLERFLDLFEGILTPLEDRIAAAHLLTDARTVPDDSLEWLAGWVGLTFDQALPPNTRRTMLRAAPELSRRRGTLSGLEQALDIATDGAITGGEIVVIEDYRLRRTFATILGVNLERETDPLLGGIGVSGNSFVGDTLFLGEEHRKEFLAVFGRDLERIADEQELAAVREFLIRLSNRATVLVHEEMAPQDLGLIRRVVALESPAHVTTEVVTASRPFIVEISSLAGVETYLGSKPRRRGVQFDRSVIGRGDVLKRTPTLDPRISAGE